MTTPAAVLAVDDNATIRKAVSMRLGARGFEVVTAVDGAEALARLDERAFDLVLLDLKMPGLGGDEVLRRIRARFSATELPVIMLAASSDARDISLTLELGANDYIIKPGDLPVLVARIRTQLTLKRTVRQLHENRARLEAAQPLLPDTGTPGDAARPALPFDRLHDNTPVTTFALSAEGNVLHVSRYGARFLGYEAEALASRPMLELYVPDDRYLAQENFASAAAMPGRIYRWDVRLAKRNGDVVWMRNTAVAIEHGAACYILLTCEDIDDAYKLSEMLSFQASHDEMTGLANRKVLESRLDQVIDSAQRERTEHAFAVLDLDQFMLVNDACGFEAGDELLRRVARRLRTVVRTRDTVARIGGDEFAVLMEDTDEARAREAVETIRRAVADCDFTWDGRRFPVSASIGMVIVDETSESVGAVFSMADTACFAAKDSGRDRVHVWLSDADETRTRTSQMRWATRINDALAGNRFELNLQPIRALRGTRRTAHFEVLLRMRDDLGRIVMPGDFLPAAERYSLSASIDRWVVQHAFEWLADASVPVGVSCSINLSGQSIGHGGMLELIHACLDAGKVSPDRVCFEVTETAAVADLVSATRFIQDLRERGCRFALDDFGSGFSSLAYLKQLPVDYLKIDGAFVRDMANDSIDLAMVRSINDIGHVMGKQTVAEFVEDDATLQLLAGMGVDFVQGYVIGRPAPLAAYRADA